MDCGRNVECELELFRLAFLVQHLREIEAADPDLLQHFRKEFRRAGKEATSHGVRFEVNIAASLLRHKVRFEKSEAPDFRVSDSPLGIECTSVRVVGSACKPDYGYKIRSIAKKKTDTACNNPETVLLIDVTNIAHSTENLDTSILRLAAADALQISSFGPIVLFVQLFNEALQRLESNYIRIDSAHIQSPLCELLNYLFPSGCHEVHSYQIPRES